VGKKKEMARCYSNKLLASSWNLEPIPNQPVSNGRLIGEEVEKEREKRIARLSIPIMEGGRGNQVLTGNRHKGRGVLAHSYITRQSCEKGGKERREEKLRRSAADPETRQSWKRREVCLGNFARSPVRKSGD